MNYVNLQAETQQEQDTVFKGIAVEGVQVSEQVVTQMACICMQRNQEWHK